MFIKRFLGYLAVWLGLFLIGIGVLAFIFVLGCAAIQYVVFLQAHLVDWQVPLVLFGTVFFVIAVILALHDAMR